MIYLATPYSHPDKYVQLLRAQTVTWAAAKLRELGLNVYSPITHGHPMADIADLPRDFEYWQEECMHHVGSCERVVVLMQPGWDVSTGVGMEIEAADELGKPVAFIEMEDLL